LPNHSIEGLNDTTAHKSHIEKLMFTCGLSEPSDYCDGKRGIIFHGHEEVAQRASRNRPAGTIVLVADSVDGNEFYDGQTKQGGIIDQIMETAGPNEDISIQMDNATSHTGNHMIERLYQDCLNNNKPIRYITQPPNSPDLNINDLCFHSGADRRGIYDMIHVYLTRRINSGDQFPSSKALCQLHGFSHGIPPYIYET